MLEDNDNALEEGLDSNNLFRQETFTDLKFGSIQRLTPVTLSGEVDPSRQAMFTGSASIMTPHGAIPVQCEIDAADLKTACELFPEAIKQAVNDLINRVQQVERERQSGIVIAKPGQIEMP